MGTLTDPELLKADFRKPISEDVLSQKIERLRQQVMDSDALPVIEPTAKLRNGEVAHLAITATWNELVRESTGYEVRERLRPLETGFVQVSDKRLIFHSEKREASIDFKEIVEISGTNGYLRLEIMGPRDPYFQLEPAAALELVVLILGRAIETASRSKQARLVGVRRKKL